MDAVAEEGRAVNNKRKRLAFVIFIVIILIGAVTLFLYLRYKATHITTDDAFVEGHILTIASKVPGTVKIIYARDNEFIKKGELLLEIDTKDYELKIKEAEAGLEAEKRRLSEVETGIEVSKKRLSEFEAAVAAARANVHIHEANLKQAESDWKRAEDLHKKEVISVERYEKAKTDYDVQVAQLKVALVQLRQSGLANETQKTVIKQIAAEKATVLSEIKQKITVLEASQLNYEYTKIDAPDDGYVTRKSVEVGNQIAEGQPLMAIVSLSAIWVVANYKETQLEKIKPGQKVKIKVDTYPGKVFTGSVESIMAGTGATFSLFPSENATGNYVKVVQRIPVKILLDKGTDPDHVLRVGMSVVPTILIER